VPRSSPSNAAIVLAALTAVAGSAVALAGWAVSGWELASSSAFIAFPVFIAVADLLEIPIERRAVFSLGLAPAIAFALLRPQEGAALPHLGEVIVVFTLGSMITMVFRLVRGRDLRLPILATRLLVVIAAAGVYRAIAAVAPETFAFAPSRMSALGLAATLLVVVAVDTVLHSLLEASERGVPTRQTLREQFRATGLLLTSTVSVGALLALAYPALHAWTMPLFLAPLAATHYSFKQVATIKTNYLQTVRALSKVPEMAGYTVRGHSSRVAKLSVEIAIELGAGDPQLQEIEYGALLHDIGRISLPDPEETPANTAALELALVGAEIVEKTGHFPRVADMVRHQNEPYRRRGEDANRELPVGAKIIKVASAYDDLTEPAGPRRTAWDALERLHLGMAYEFDPKVIQALTRVLEQRGLI
jgi:putative nucleotidyltransferase with HDIG domain